MAKTTTYEVTAEMNIPKVPNSLIGDTIKLRVGDVTDEALREIGKLWTEALIKRAHEQRAQTEGDG